MENHNYNTLSFCDKGIGKCQVRLNGQDITQGILKYSISRNSENDNTLILSLEMVVVPDKVEIELKKNSKSSDD